MNHSMKRIAFGLLFAAGLFAAGCAQQPAKPQADAAVQLFETPEAAVQARLLRGEPTWPNPTGKHGRRVWYARSVGREPLLADVILERVREALLLFRFSNLSLGFRCIFFDTKTGNLADQLVGAGGARLFHRQFAAAGGRSRKCGQSWADSGQLASEN